MPAISAERRGWRAAFRAALAVLLLTVVCAVPAAPALAHHTLNCTPMSDPACKDITRR